MYFCQLDSLSHLNQILKTYTGLIRCHDIIDLYLRISYIYIFIYYLTACSSSSSIYYPGEFSPLAGVGQSFPFESFKILAKFFYGRMPLLAPTTVIGSGPSHCLKRHICKAAGYPQLSAVGLAFA